MKPILARYGIQISQPSGLQILLEDYTAISKACVGKQWINLSSGNPTLLPRLSQLWRDCQRQLLTSSEYDEVLCRYGDAQGYAPLIEAIANDFNRRYGLNLSDRNILITPGSQSLYFYAANVFGGYIADGILKQIVLPLSPEYTGYERISLTPEALVAYKPTLEINEAAHRFKYRPDFSQLRINETTGCVIFSRPCNPSGNVLADEEVEKIVDLADCYDVPVLIDSAYGPPFPALNFTPMTPVFRRNVLHCISLSKAGLPGERVGVAIGEPKLIEILKSFQSNLCIHSSCYGQALAARAIASGTLADIAINVIRPHYRQKMDVLENTLARSMPSDLPWFLHSSQGSIFAWLWLKDLPISDWELYQQLKQVGVLIAPGRVFFPGLQENWSHKQQCIRISLAASSEDIDMGIQRLARVAQQLYCSS